MLGSTHSRIAQHVSKELGITEKRKIGLLVNGSNQPDSWAHFPHHFGKEREIVDNILQARRLYLESDDECFHRLGIALHYIADKWTLRPRLADKHTKWERIIDKAPIVDDSKLKEVISESSIPTKTVERFTGFIDVVKGGPSKFYGLLTSPVLGFTYAGFAGQVAEYSARAFHSSSEDFRGIVQPRFLLL